MNNNAKPTKWISMNNGNRVATSPMLPSLKESLKQEHTSDEAQLCPICDTVAVVNLAPHELAKQPDETTHVCHPVLGGCNHGFSVDGFVLSLVDNG